jgi:TM2 domain-containing membrane protein YozV
MREKAIRGSHLPQRSPALAALFSAIVPGSGKLYAGRPTDGLYSLLLVGTNIAIACAYGQDDQWTKAGLFGTVGFFFHLGNIYGSAVQAERFNHRRRQAFLHDLTKSTHPQRWLWELGEDTRPQDETVTTEKTLALAEDLFQVGRYDRAITEYKRHLFYFPEDPRRGQVRYKIGLAYLNLNDQEEARTHLRIIWSVEAAEELQFRSRLRWAQSFLSQGLVQQGKWALRNLLSGPLVAGDESRTAQVQYWQSICALLQGEWAQAAEDFHELPEKYPRTSYALRAERLTQAAEQGCHLPHRSPTLATALSVVLPGSGQVYCGRWWDGLFSLALNASVGYLTVEAFHDGRRLDGMLLASLLWARFYLGGQQNAARHAREYNRRVREEHLRQYDDLLAPEYKE